MVKKCYSHRPGLALAVVALLSGWTNAAAQGVNTTGLKDQLLVLLNGQRSVNGLPPLRRVDSLDAAAQSYSDTMMLATAGGSIYLSHTGPDGSSLADRVSAAGYGWYTLGEDLAAGETTPQQAVRDWMSSSAHRANILNPAFQDVGIGITVGPGTWPDGRFVPRVYWWTVDFGQGAAPDNSNPSPPAAVVTGYSTLDGTPTSMAPFGSYLLINGQNLSNFGGVFFHGRPTSALFSSPTMILVLVPLQPSYPDVGPVTLSLSDQTAIGPDFITYQPGALPPAPAILSVPLPAASSSPAGQPAITSLTNTNQKRISAVSQGQLLQIHGKGFGANSLFQSRVLFLTADGYEVDGSVWDWADDRITVFAPYLWGPLQVCVQVNANGRTLNSNQVALTVQ